VQRFYPAVLERGPKQSYGVWFPDFAGCVAAGASQEQAIARAQQALVHAVESLAERDEPLPEPTPFQLIAIPKDCEFVAFFAVGVEPPNPSERVNIYLSRSLLTRADSRAAELGMSRSSFFGYAITMSLSMPAIPGFGRVAPAVILPDPRDAETRKLEPRRRRKA
jgi:predicted RNase H-like HicB family nuclease